MSVTHWQKTPPEPAPGASALSGPGLSPAEDVAVSLTEVSKVYGRGNSALLALDKVSLTANRSEFVCLIGASGCGKSTLLSLVAGLDEPTAGTIATPGGRVIEEYQVPRRGPRRIDSVEVAELASQITDRLREEMSRHGD